MAKGSFGLIAGALLLLVGVVFAQTGCDDVLGQEKTLVGEEDFIKAVVLRNTILQNNSYPRMVMRDQHPKPHGCVYGKLKINKGLPDALRNGIFGQEDKAFDVWVRFSNGDGFDDSVNRARGLALKVLNVPGERLNPEGSSQDFIFLASTFNGFFAGSVADYVAVAANQTLFFATHPLSAQSLAALASTSRESVLQGPYENQLPVRIGTAAVKLSLTRCNGTTHFAANITADPRDYLRRGLAAQLDPLANYDEGCFVLGARQQVDVCSTPIENSSVPWTSPVVPLAVLTIPKQRFDTPSVNAFCENLSFTPWNGLKSHQPLGSNSRARKLAYDASSINRHNLNNEALISPTTTPLTPPTQAPTQAPTQPPTQAPTQAPTQPPTQAPPVCPPCNGNTINLNFGGLLGRN